MPSLPYNSFVNGSVADMLKNFSNIGVGASGIGGGMDAFSGSASGLSQFGHMADAQTAAGIPATTGPQFSNMSGFGANVPTFQLALSGLSTIGNLWGAFQAQKLAKQQFNFTRDITNTNLGNQIKSYNTQLQDRASNRAIVEGKDYSGWYDTNKLNRSGS